MYVSFSRLCVCVPGLLCCAFNFPWCGVGACHLGGKAGSTTKNSQSTNGEFLQPTSDAQLVLADLVNQMWCEEKAASGGFFYFTDTVSHPLLLLPIHQSALISHTQALGTVLNNKELVTFSQMCF